MRKPLLCILLAFMLSACSVRELHEARQTVAVADSLRNAGTCYADSLRLAQAIRIFDAWRWLYPTDGAHADYHYGRLLAQQGNYQDAMQYFIRITRCTTSDKTIVGRAYSNMGDMACQQGYDTLAVALYEQSALAFRQAADTIGYTYALNGMAFCYGNMPDIEQSILLLDSAAQLTSDTAVHAKLMETKASAYYSNMQFDSTLYWLNRLQTFCPDAFTDFCLLRKAQAFYSLQQKDSATRYAQTLVKQCDEPHYLVNAYYIILHDDLPKTQQELVAMDEHRMDHNDATNAIALSQRAALITLQQYLQQSDLRRRYSTGAFILLIFIIVSISIYRYKSKYKHNRIQLSIRHRQNLLQQIDNETQNAVHNRLLLEQQVEHLLHKEQNLKQSIQHKLENAIRTLNKSTDLRTELHLDDYNKMRPIANKQLYNVADILQNRGLSPREVQFCILVLLDCNRSQIADLLYYSKSSIGKTKDNIAKKLGGKGCELRNLIIESVCIA